MPRKAKEEAEKTRARILASALALFVKQGYEHTTFTEIAARLKMTKGAVYWYFDTKEALLVALVDEMVAKFSRQMSAELENRELTFPVVAQVLVAQAGRIVADPRTTAFFLLLHGQIRWTDASMAKIRTDLLSNERFGPLEAVRAAVRNDVQAGRVRADVDPAQMASICISTWDGLLSAHISKFLQQDMAATMSLAFDALWTSIRK